MNEQKYMEVRDVVDCDDPSLLTEDQPKDDPQQTGAERGGLLFNGKTAKEWFELHEVIRHDYARVIGELEAQDREIKKHEELNRDNLRKLHPHGVQQ